MSLASTVARVTVVITALPQTIPVFAFNQAADLIVYDGGASNTGRTPADTLVLGSDYTVTGGGYDGLNALQTGSIVVVGTGSKTVLVGDTITVLRNISPVQDTSFVSTGPKTPLLTEQDDDNLTALIQQVLADLKPAMRAPPDEDVDWTLPGASLRTTSFPYFDGTGSLTLLSLASLSTLLSGGTSVSGTTSANYFFAGPTSGSANTPAFRAMVTADLGTTLTPQVAQLGINVLPYSIFPQISYHATMPQWLGYDGTIGPLYSGGIRGYSVTNQGGYVALGTLQNNAWTPVLVINHQNAATFASTIATAGGVPFDITAVNSVSPTSPNRTVSIILNGTTYYLAAKTTND